MRYVRRLAVVASVPALLLCAPPAQADDASFVARFISEGIGNGHMTTTTAVRMGHIMCDRIRHGEAPADVARTPRGRDIDGGRMAQVAQQEICPDTLG